MLSKQLFLVGEDPAIKTNVKTIHIDSNPPLEQFNVTVADAFSILDPNGIGFQSYDGTVLEDIDDILDSEGLVGVTIDGKAVREIPGPSGMPMFGSWFEVYPDHLGNHDRMFQKYGPVIKHVDMGKTTYMTNDPHLASLAFQETPFWSKLISEDHPLFSVKNPDAGVFLGDTDTEAWRQVHKFLAPALSPKAVKHYTPTLHAAVEKSFRALDELDSRNEAFNALQITTRLGAEAIGVLALGMEFNNFENLQAPMHPIVSEINEIVGLVKAVSSKGSWYRRLPFGTPARARALQKDFEDRILKAVEEKEEKNAGEPNLPIADAALEADNIADFFARAIDEKGRKFPRESISGAMGVVIGAGHITTAATMSQMLYDLTMHPEIQDKLLQELVDFGVHEHTEWTWDLVQSMPYLDKFVKEVLRSHGPSHNSSRTALRDQIIPGGYKISKGAVLTCGIYHIHHNPDIWQKPYQFDPERFEGDAVKQRPKGSFIPFASGPRMCPGFNFALEEVKTVIPTLLYRYEFSRYGDEPIEYDIENIVIRPLNLYIRAKRRTHWPTPTATSS